MRIKDVIMRILFMSFVLLFTACLDLYDPKRDIKPVQIPPVDHVINGKRYSIRLYHSASSLSENFFIIDAVDTSNKAQYTTGTKAGWRPDSAVIFFKGDGMIEMRLTISYDNRRKVYKDTLRFIPNWRPASDWQ